MNKTTDRFTHSVQRGREKQARRLHKGVLCHCTMVQVRVSVKIRLIPLLWMGNWEMLILCECQTDFVCDDNLTFLSIIIDSCEVLHRFALTTELENLRSHQLPLPDCINRFCQLTANSSRRGRGEGRCLS